MTRAMLLHTSFPRKRESTVFAGTRGRCVPLWWDQVVGMPSAIAWHLSCRPQEGEGAERKQNDREQAGDYEGRARGRAEDAQLHTDTRRRDYEW